MLKRLNDIEALKIYSCRIWHGKNVAINIKLFWQTYYWFYCFLWTKCFEISNEVTLVIRLYNLFQIYPNSSEKEAKWYFSLQRFSLEHFKQLRMKLYVTWIQNWSDKSRIHFIVSFEKSSKIDNEVTTVLGYIIYSIYTPILQKNGQILILFTKIFYPRNIIHFNNVLINYK